MSLLKAVYERIHASRCERERNQVKSYERLVAAIIDDVRGHKKSKTDEAETVEFIQSCIDCGLAKDEQVTKLHEAAVNLKSHIDRGEAEEVDIEQREIEFRRVCDESHARMAEANRAIEAAKQANYDRIEGRQAAQRVIRNVGPAIFAGLAGG